MIPTNYQRLIESLLAKTQSGQVFWNRASDTQFKLILNSTIITVDWWRNQGNLFTSIDIYNMNGDIIDRYTVSEVGNPAEFPIIQDFYMRVYNTVNLKLEQTINNILGEINQYGIVGKKENIK